MWLLECCVLAQPQVYSTTSIAANVRYLKGMPHARQLMLPCKSSIQQICFSCVRMRKKEQKKRPLGNIW